MRRTQVCCGHLQGRRRHAAQLPGAAGAVHGQRGARAPHGGRRTAARAGGGARPAAVRSVMCLSLTSEVALHQQVYFTCVCTQCMGVY